MSTMATDPKREIETDIAILDEAFKEFSEAATKWCQLNSPNISFRNLVIELINAVGFEYYQLKIGVRKAPQLAAWAARNLLELRIITSYVLLSKQNADRFVGDMFSDGIEFFEAIQRIQKRHAVDAGIDCDSGPLQQTLINLTTEMTNRSLPSPAKHLQMRDMAALASLSDEYRDMNRICSKLVHRTAFSVLAFREVGELQYVAPLMFHTGSRYALEVWELLKGHVERYGMEPKPKR